MDNIYYLILGLVAFFPILFLLPTEAKKIKKQFKREVTALTESIDERIVRIQGKAVLIEELTSPIFLKEAAVVETKFYEMSEYAKRNTGFSSNKGDWSLKNSKSQKVNFLLQCGGEFALIDVEHCKWLLTKNIETVNNYGDIEELFFNGKYKYIDLAPRVLKFISTLGLNAKYYKHSIDEIIKLDECAIENGNHISAIGNCTLRDVKHYPELFKYLPEYIDKLYIITGTETEPVYLTDDFGILFG